MVFKDRYQAGRILAQKLAVDRNDNLFILGLARGGVPVAFEVAKALHSPLDTLIVRKIGAPFNPEYALGAVAEGEVTVWNFPEIENLGLSRAELLEEKGEEDQEIQRRIDEYRSGRQLPNLSAYTVILIDDGLATGFTAQAAVEAVSLLDPQKIIFATPICAKDTAEKLAAFVTKVVCLIRPEEMQAVGAWYHDFNQVTDQEVVSLLNDSRRFSANYKRPPAHL